MKKILLFFVLFFCAYSAFGSADMFSDLKGKNLSYNEIISAQKTILFFWTSNCQYCISEFTYISQNLKLLEGVNIYFINIGEDRFTINTLAKHLKLSEKITEKILLDPETFLADKFSIIGVPTYIFMFNGKIVKRSYYMDGQLLEEVFKR